MNKSVLALVSLLAATATAQETYWVANRASSDLMEVTHWGTVRNRVPMSSSLRSAHQAPDGKVWVVRFIQSTLDIYDPATGTMTTASHSQGSAYSIAFDAQGTAWVSGGSGVENFDSNGNSIQAYPLTVGAPLGITIDNLGNKWIAHRVNPAMVSRIDTAGIVTSYPIPGTSMQPVGIIADYPGFPSATNSRIWVTGDGSSDLVELDTNGAVMNVFPLGFNGLNAPTFDLNGNIWVGSFTNGTLEQIDPATGTTLSGFSLTPSVNGLATDSLGRLLASARITFSGGGPPCEVRRIDPATGALEMNTTLEFGGNNAAGTQSPPSTPFQYGLVVAPLGDLDNDGEPNFIEIVAGTFPNDGCSNSVVSLHTSGVSDATNGGSVDWNVRIGVGVGFISWAFGRVPAGSGISLPGASCEVLLDPATVLGTLFLGGSTAVTQTIPMNPALIGVRFYGQALAIDPSGTPTVSNLSGLELW